MKVKVIKRYDKIVPHRVMFTKTQYWHNMYNVLTYSTLWINTCMAFIHIHLYHSVSMESYNDNLYKLHMLSLMDSKLPKVPINIMPFHSIHSPIAVNEHLSHPQNYCKSHFVNMYKDKWIQYTCIYRQAKHWCHVYNAILNDTSGLN